jgi:prepilin-type N-terminal cleavage/methylation domain-containing protein
MRRRAARGFTLLEILVAIAIFAFVASAAMTTMADSDYMSASGRRARELRMLAERKIGEILAFEQHFDELESRDGDFESDYPEYGERFKGWTWNLELRNVIVFGVSTAEDAEYLFGPPSEDEKTQAAQQTGAQGTTGQQGPPGQQPSSSAKLGKTQELRELTLRVSSPTDDGGGDSVQIIVFAPKLIPKQGAAKSGG